MSRLKEIFRCSSISVANKLVLPGTISRDKMPQKTFDKAEKMRGRFNRTDFKSICTGGPGIEAGLREGYSTGVPEWRVHPAKQ